MVSVAARVRDVGRDLDLSIELEAGETLAVLGPNGAGKSTMLAAIAGLWRPRHAQVRLGERVLQDAHTWVPPHRRSIALLAQEPRLFPHLTVAENVAFGPRSRRDPQADAVAVHWLDRVSLATLAHRRPRELSGGQAQRAAIARALAVEPQAVLLDEPLAALDAEAVPEVRRVLREVLADRTAIIVTHEPLDALALADRVVIVEAGRVVHEGEPQDVIAHPRSAFGAALAELNLVVGRATAPDRVGIPDGRELTGLAAAALTPGQPATATFAPTAVALHRSRPYGSPRNVLPGVVSGVEQRPGTCRVTVGGWIADVTTAAAAELDLAPGASVWVSIKATEIRLDPA